jgi:HPt (histidine-containing phosphotransfer) domain-containing protein
MGFESLANVCRQAENLPAERWLSDAPSLIRHIDQTLSPIIQAQATYSSQN